MRRRRLIILLLVLAALPVGAYFGLRFYLGSEWVRQAIETQLAESIGARVELSGVDGGLFSTSLYGLRVFLPGDIESPSVAVDELRLEVPLWKLGDEAEILQHLTLDGAAITLRFNRDGRILVEPPPQKSSGANALRVQLDNARFTLKQEGKPDLRVNGIRAAIGTQGDKLTLKGTVLDPSWGEWIILGTVEPTSGAASLQLKSDRVQVTQDRLEGLPFVDADVWKEIRAEGTSSVDLTVRFTPPDRQAHYRVVLEPKETSLRVAAIDLAASDVAGKLVIEDGRIVLQDIQGCTANGSLTLQGDLDFRTRPERLLFRIEATGLDLRQLPRSWDLPEFLEGKLSGKATLGVDLLKGGVRTTGQGEGQISDARIGGAVTAEPVVLQLVSQGKGFRFLTGRPRSGLSFRFASEFGDVLADVLQHAGRPFADASRGLIHWQIAPPRDSRPPTYLRFHVDLKEVELGRFLAGIGIPLAIPVEGQASIDLHIDLPVDTLNEPKCYRMDGTIRLAYLKAADMEFHDVAARLDYRDGVLRVTNLAGRSGLNGLPVGSFSGSASLGLVPAGHLETNLRLEGVPLPRCLTDGQGLSGWLTGNLLVQVPVNRFGDAHAWQATARIEDSRLALAGRMLALTADRVQLDKGSLSTTAIEGTVDGLPVAAAGTLALPRPHAFVLALTLKDLEANQLCRLLDVPAPSVPIQGGITWTARLEGALDPLRFQAVGRAAAAALQVDRIPLQRLELNWKTDGKSLEVEALSARYSFGQLDGSAKIPLEGDQPGLAEMQFREIDLAPLAQQLAGQNGVQGRGFGTIRTDIAKPGADGRRKLTARIQYSLPRVKVQALAGERLQGTASFDGTEWSYRCDGEVLAGRLHVEGTMAGNQSPISHLTVEGAQIGRLRREMMADPDSLPLHGRVDLELSIKPEAGEHPAPARGRLWVQGLRWDTSELAERIQADVQLRGSELILDNANGTFCRGLLRGRAILNTTQLERSLIDLSLDRGEAQDLLAPWPDLAKHASGTVEARLQTTPGQPWRTSGVISLARGRLFGIDIAEWRVPIDLAFSPGSGTGQLEVRESNAQIARGRVVGQASYSWGHSNRLETKVRFFDVNLHELIPAAADFNRLDGGTASGRLDLAGTNIASMNDLTGTLEATLKQTQVFEFPVFQQLAPYVVPPRSRRVPVEAGDVKARLAHGLVHVERLRLTGGVVQLLLEGTLSLQGRVDFDVTASTGLNAIQASMLRRMGIDLPASGPIPRSTLARATSQLSARLVRLRVSGSVHNPQVQIVPLYQLTEDALRFFLTGSR